jgi:hypothetical protein
MCLPRHQEGALTQKGRLSRCPTYEVAKAVIARGEKIIEGTVDVVNKANRSRQLLRITSRLCFGPVAPTLWGFTQEATQLLVPPTLEHLLNRLRLGVQQRNRAHNVEATTLVDRQVLQTATHVSSRRDDHRTAAQAEFWTDEEWHLSRTDGGRELIHLMQNDGF